VSKQTARTDFQSVFAGLRPLLAKHEKKLVVQDDTPEHYYLNTSKQDDKGRPIFFGAVTISKRYVSYHLMPVYVYPDLLEDIPPDLRKRMQGKSCFNFTSLEPGLVKALDDLTKRGFERYRDGGMV